MSIITDTYNNMYELEQVANDIYVLGRAFERIGNITLANELYSISKIIIGTAQKQRTDLAEYMANDVMRVRRDLYSSFGDIIETVANG